MNENQLRLFGITLVNKSIEQFIDNNTNDFKVLYDRFRELTEDDCDAVHWHSDIDVYLKTMNLKIKPKNTIGEQQLEYLTENTNRNPNDLILNLYSLQYFFEYGSQYYTTKYNGYDIQ